MTQWKRELAKASRRLQAEGLSDDAKLDGRFALACIQEELARARKRVLVTLREELQQIRELRAAARQLTQLIAEVKSRD